jgi:hypothetical protein
VATMVQRICQQCGTTFSVSLYDVNRGRGKCCSSTCSEVMMRLSRWPEGAKTESRVCLSCGVEFPVPYGRIQNGGGKYCSAKCSVSSLVSQHKFNPDGINTGNPLEKTTCPISLETLHFRYWKKGESIKDIAFALKVSPHSIRSWLNRAGITIRKPSESMRLKYKTKPHLKEMARRNAINLCQQGKLAGFGGSEITIKKARKQRIKNCTARLISVVCALPGCGKILKVQPWRMARVRHKYCCQSHATTHQHQLRREAKAQARLAAAHEAAKQEAERVFGRKFD